jgi:hypothetical protein
MSSRTRTLAFVNAAWMTFVWVTRIRNAAGDDAISSTTRTLAYLLSGACLAAAAALIVIALRRGPVKLLIGIAYAHCAVWVLRGTQIALGDRGAAFKVVHVVLALVSIGLGALLIRSASRTSPSQASTVQVTSDAL